MSSSGTSIKDPYGGLGGQAAWKTFEKDLAPWLQYLGFGPPAGSRRAGRQEARLGQATGPMAALLEQLRGALPGIFPEAMNVGSEVSAAGSQAFTSLQNEIQQALAGLPEFQGEAAAAGKYASQYAQQAFSPVANEDLYQTALRRAQGAARPGQAAAGTLGTGAGTQAMTDIAQNLAFQFGGLQNEQRQAAIPLLGGAATGGANLLGLGPNLAAGGLSAVPQLAQALSAQFGIPLDAASNLLALMTGAVGPTTQLVGATRPFAAPYSSSFGGSIGAKH